MKHSSKGNFTVYEESDICSLDEYSETLGEELEDKLEEVEQEIEESAYDDTEVIEEIEALQTENTRLKATLPTTTGEGENITLSKTAELEFIQPPLPRGNSEQVQYSGKNLFDGLMEKGTFNPSGINASDITRIRSVNYIKVKPNTQYTISYTNNTSSVLMVSVSFYDTNDYTTPRLDYVNWSTTNPLVITVPDNCQYARFLIAYQTAAEINISAVSNVQLEQGTTRTAYEPYVGGTASPNPFYPQEITNVTGDVEVLVQNKNLFVEDDFVEKASSTLNVTQQNDEVVIKRKNLTSYNYPIDCKTNTSYTISFYMKNLHSDYYIYFVYDDDSTTPIKATSAVSEFTKITKTSTANKTLKYIRFELYGWDNVISLKDIQLEQGTATTYTPHKEQTFTFPLGTQRMYLGDYLADDGIHHVRKQITLDGSETWTGAGNVFQSVADTTPNKGDVSSNAYSNYFMHHYYPSAITSNIQNGEFGWNSSKLLTIRNDNVTGSANFKTWLSTHNVTVEYELATEEITPYTTEQQQAYNEIKQAISYEEQTNISGSSDESNPLFEVQAVEYKEPDYWTIAYVNTQIGNAIGGAY